MEILKNCIYPNSTDKNHLLFSFFFSASEFATEHSAWESSVSLNFGFASTWKTSWSSAQWLGRIHSSGLWQQHAGHVLKQSTGKYSISYGTVIFTRQNTACTVKTDPMVTQATKTQMCGNKFSFIFSDCRWRATRWLGHMLPGGRGKK